MGILSKIMQTLFPPAQVINVIDEQETPKPENKISEQITYEEGYYTLRLENAGNKKIQIIKTIREVTGFGLKEAKEITESAPSTIKTNLDKSTALKYKEELETYGATITMIDNSDINRSASDQLN